jgi:uncharacterized protein (DUF362 family)
LLGLSGCRRGVYGSTAELGDSSQNLVEMEAQAVIAPQAAAGTSRVSLVRTSDRAAGVRRAMDLLELGDIRDKRVFLKPNFNSADPAPGSSHNDTLSQMVRSLQQRGVGSIVVGDRSGMGDTRKVMSEKGIFAMAEELGFETVVFDEIDATGWTHIERVGFHWSRGFALPTAVLQSDAIIQTCCLKTHRFGGHFTMALKNSVGFAAKTIPGEGYDYMRELHRSPHQRLMIAELNAAYRPTLIVLEGIEAFVRGGPDRGELTRTEVVIAGTDPVAIDAIGVAVLRDHGTTDEVARGSIFELEQIARAAGLGVGASNADAIEIVTDDTRSKDYGMRLEELLRV